MTRPDTLTLAKEGDLGARDLLLKEWLPVVLRWCSALGGPRVDAEEAAHDVIMTVLRRKNPIVRIPVRVLMYPRSFRKRLSG